MKTVIKTLLATVAISLLGAVTTGMCASAAVSKGVENTIAWTFDSNTATLTLDKKRAMSLLQKAGCSLRDQVQYIEIAGMNLGAHMGYDDPDFYPNLKKVYGSWHNPEKSWKEGDPELLWEIDYTGSDPVITLDAEGGHFCGGKRPRASPFGMIFLAVPIGGIMRRMVAVSCSGTASPDFLMISI